MTTGKAQANPPHSLCLLCGLCCNGVLFKDVKLQPGDNAERLTRLGLSLEPAGRVEGVSRRSAGPSDALAVGSNSKGQNHRASRPACAAKFAQPCRALQADGRCRIYAERPRRCREFDCALLKSLAGGHCDWPVAVRTIELARARADRVRGLLRELGDHDEQLALSLRFKRMHRRLAQATLDEETAGTFSQLTLAVHDLNLLLRAAFWP